MGLVLGRSASGLVDVAPFSPKYPTVILAGDWKSRILGLISEHRVVLRAGPLGAVLHRSLWEQRKGVEREGKEKDKEGGILSLRVQHYSHSSLEIEWAYL